MGEMEGLSQHKTHLIYKKQLLLFSHYAIL